MTEITPSHVISDWIEEELAECVPDRPALPQLSWNGCGTLVSRSVQLRS